MTTKTVLVTGGTGGIGRAAAIADESGNPAVDVFVGDMSSQTEVRRLASEVLAAYSHLDVLVNNVGGFWAHRPLTADGLGHTFALNHLAPFLFTNRPTVASVRRSRRHPNRTNRTDT